MRVHFKGTDYQIPARLSAIATKKINALKKLMGQGKHEAFAYVDMGKETAAHQNGKIWKADINLDVDGTRFHAKALAERIEQAIDTAVTELKRELHTAHKKRQSIMKRGGALFKATMQSA